MTRYWAAGSIVAGMLICSAVGAKTALRDVFILEITSIPPSGLTQVLLERPDGTMTKADPMPGGQGYKLNLSLRAPDGTLDISDLTLVADFGTDFEPIYLRPTPRHSATFSIVVFHDTTAWNDTSMQQIEALLPDVQGFFEAYYEGRSAYIKFAQSDQFQPLAIRAAKAWYGASYNLVSLSESPFRIDPKASEVMKDYEARAKTDPVFDRLYRRIMPLGEFDKMDGKMTAAPFQMANFIQDYIAAGDYQSANQINQKLQDQIDSLDSESKKKVVIYGGINDSILAKNKSYIQTISNSGPL